MEKYLFLADLIYLTDTILNRFTTPLHHWYRNAHRDLPWRRTGDPYLIWISETILQQTRVAQGLPYYLRFVERFPDVTTLAGVSEDELMKYWEGLGYYSRARNLHSAAKTIAGKHDGKFPESFEDIRNLKGVGDYTAAAVSSMAFGQPRAVVDGNVIRVLSRYFGIYTQAGTAQGKREIQDLAGFLLPDDNPGLHNQAVMELGALICTPKNPSCSECPVRADCHAFLHGKTDELPVKSKTIKKTERHFTYLVVRDDRNILIGKRTGRDIWMNLYQFPLIETSLPASDEEVLSHPMTTKFLTMEGARLVSISRRFRHILTHRRISARFVNISVAHLNESLPHFLKINREEISNFAFPVLIRNYMIETKLLYS